MKSDKNKSKKTKGNFGNFLKKTALIGTLALPFFFSSPKVSAQTNQNAANNQGKNYIYANDKKITAAGDGIFAKTFVQNVPLTPKSKISLDSLFHAKKGKVYFDVINAKKGISNIKNYIVSQGELTGKEKAFKNHLNSLEKFAEKNPGDSNTVEILNNALKDGTLSVKEDSLYDAKKDEWKIKDGAYIIRAKSSAKDNLKTQSIPIYTNISTHHEKSPKIEGKGIESYLHGYNKNNTKQGGKTFIEYDVNPSKEKEENKEKKNSNKDFSLIAQGNYGKNFYDAGIGFKLGNIAGVFDFSKAKDQTIRDVETPLGETGRYFSGKEQNIDQTGIGANIEWHPGNLYFGVGGKHWSYTTKTTEKMHSSNGDVLKNNTNSESKTDLSGKIYGGYNISLSDKFNLGIQGGYGTKFGPFGGIRFSYDIKQK
ncbi:MAG TPA: hypothetical protein VJ912_02400 [Candidatus Nanoarchaeia archaeon]|nr:hypothetical protein [Candidatus Nanoarchaeia archaeon]